MKFLCLCLIFLSSATFAAEIKISAEERKSLKEMFCAHSEPGHYGSCELVSTPDEKKNCLATAALKVFDVPGADSSKLRLMNVRFKKFRHQSYGYYNESVCDVQLSKSGRSFKITGVYAGE